ncbi:hypothetical protein LY13_001843 [Prauserella aidingensis]|uniref:MmcQ/YjbR family DNA-binding protein n=1 Tax=Prauserella aidingensis TaxID=387890 RepID=UPI0020A5345C|nr:MmcQ/YjbR family DNA-binding protein [Prauserella aidingensis]MCP2253095.1 hypothetical protein [Prauserella aidingensis]
MATLTDVERIAAGLPEVTMRPAWGQRMWRVRDRGFVWERPLNGTDRAALGDATPDGELAAVRVADEPTTRELLAAYPDRFLTIPHFGNSPVLLIRLEATDTEHLREMIVDAWLDRAPKRLAAAYLAEHPED